MGDGSHGGGDGRRVTLRLPAEDDGGQTQQVAQYYQRDGRNGGAPPSTAPAGPKPFYVPPSQRRREQPPADDELVGRSYRLGDIPAEQQQVAIHDELEDIPADWERRLEMLAPSDPFNIPSSRRDPTAEKPLTWEKFRAGTVNEAVQVLIPYLENTSEHHQVIYFDGWRGLGASAVLKSVGEHPPPPLRKRYDPIIHIDCSRWKSRRALQRMIADKLNLAQDVMDIFDRQDEEEDFSGVDEGSRIEIRDAGRKIHEALHGNSSLVVFHNGGNDMVNLNDFGIPEQTDRWSSIIGKVLWTFRGRLRGIPGMKQTTDQEHISPSSEPTKPGYQSPTEEVFFLTETEQEFSNKKSPQTKSIDKSHIYLYSYFAYGASKSLEELVHEEATEIAQYTQRFDVTPEVAALCCKYLLLLNAKGVNNLDYNWPVHASNYWVCDGIMKEYHEDKAWEVATALHEEMVLEDLSSYKLPIGDTTQWIVATKSDSEEIKPDTTSFFWVKRTGSVGSLPDNMFQRSEQLHVLKLCLCTFNFSSPPFLHCPNIRFLGLEKCKDQPNKLEETKEEEDEQDRRRINFFQCLLVLDICYTDWEFNLSPNIIERMDTNIREISIKRGRIWSNQGWTWRHLQNIHKLRVIEPTCPWETTDNIDEFRDMLKLEHLDLSGNNTIQVLPCLSGATSLRTLVLDGCIGLEHIGPESLPPSLETFSFDVEAAEYHNKVAKISCISMTGCTRLVNFRLCGSLPELEELNLSNTSVKTLDLKDEVVQVPCLQRIILLGCMRLRAILWPDGGMAKLMMLCIDTRGSTEAAESKELEEHAGRACVSVTDMRFLQSLLVASGDAFFWKNAPFNMSLCLSSTSKKNMAPYSTRELVGTPQQKSLISKQSYGVYSDVKFDEATVNHDGSTAQRQQFQPLDLHVEIGEGISNTNVVAERGTTAARFFIEKAKSLLVHDNFSIDTVIPESIVTDDSWSGLKWCCTERCPKLDTVFTVNYSGRSRCFSELETFWASELLKARCIWNIRGRSSSPKSFRQLRAIYLHLCPRLTFVLPLSWWYDDTTLLSSLETIHIVYCGAVSQVFPVEAELLNELSTAQRGDDELEFPKLKHVHLHELPKLHQICAVKMFAPKLETIWVRGCWSLKRLPATADRPNSRPAVDCEKDWWAKLQWDGKEVGHHPSLFQPQHSKYYKKTMLRGSVLL